MNFELTTATAAKVTDFDILSDKDREPDTNPGVAIALSMLLANECLTMFDGFLRGALYTKNASSAPGEQQTIATDMPNLTPIGKAIGEFGWNAELTGYTMTFDYGVAGISNIVLKDCKLSAWRIFPKEGGSVQVKFKVESPDVPELVRGKLTGFKSQEVHVLFAPPVVVDEQQDLEEQPGRTPAPPARRQSKRERLAATLGVEP